MLPTFPRMKSIKIVKQKPDESAVTAATKNKPATPSTRQIVSTVKSWIAESKERKQSRRRSLPVLTVVIMISFVLVAAGTPEPHRLQSIKIDFEVVR